MSNTIVRTISGTGFVAVMLAGLLVNKFLFAALVIFMMTAMMYEFYSITMHGSYRFSRLLAILSGITLFGLMFLVCAYGINPQYIAIAILPLLIVMVNSLYVKDKTGFGKFSDLYTGLLYIALPLSLSNLLAFFNRQFDGTLLLYFFIIIWSSDIGGFIFGCSLGKKWDKKLFPAISPKKTWIGMWGGMLCAVLSAVAARSLFDLQFPIIHAIILAIIMDVAGVYGDLFESQWKRYYEVKDSGSIIPGHGGMLDRFDSSLFAIPAGSLYLILMHLFADII